MPAAIPSRMTAAEYVALAGKAARKTARAAAGARGVKVPSRGTRKARGRMTLEQVRAIVAADPTQAECFELALPLTPTPKERPRQGATSEKTGKRTTYTPAQTRRFERNVKAFFAHAMRQAGRSPYRVPVDVDFVHVFRGEPDEFPTASSDGDLSNLTKAVEDAVNKVLYVDDCLVMATPRHGKECGPEDRVVVRVVPKVGPGGRYPREREEADRSGAASLPRLVA